MGRQARPKLTQMPSTAAGAFEGWHGLPDPRKNMAR